MAESITSQDIEVGIATECRGFFLVSSAPLPRSMQCVVDAFWEAARRIAPAISVWHRIQVIFATAPFSIKLSNGELRFIPSNPELIGVTIENLVFLDCNRIAPLHPQIQVACVLEELVHALMHIRDESLVSVVVARLYPGVTLTDGRYTVSGSLPPT